MKRVRAIALVALTLGLTGCASLFNDPLRTAYESGQITREEYERRCLERNEAMARDDPAHWELQQTFSKNHYKLTHE